MTVDPAVSDGYWVMLAPLPPGDHEIVFGGSGIYFGWEFTVDITYHITVAPGAQFLLAESSVANPRFDGAAAFLLPFRSDGRRPSIPYR